MIAVAAGVHRLRRNPQFRRRCAVGRGLALVQLIPHAAVRRFDPPGHGHVDVGGQEADRAAIGSRSDPKLCAVSVVGADDAGSSARRRGRAPLSATEVSAADVGGVDVVKRGDHGVDQVGVLDQPAAAGEDDDLAVQAIAEGDEDFICSVSPCQSLGIKLLPFARRSALYRRRRGRPDTPLQCSPE